MSEGGTPTSMGETVMSQQDALNDAVASAQAAITPGLSRRGVFRTAARGVALAAGGLALPGWLEEAAARDGAHGGELGGRRGKDHKGRHKKRSHGDKKDKGRPGSGAPQDHGPFRSTGLTVTNKTNQPLQCTFFFRTKTGLDDYGLPIANGTQTINPNQSSRYDTDHYRVGVLVPKVLGPSDLYADVRNVSFFFPRGGVTQGSNLDPHGGNFGGALIPEQNFAENEEHQEQNVVLKRLTDDSKGAKRIEWELTIY